MMQMMAQCVEGMDTPQMEFMPPHCMEGMDAHDGTYASELQGMDADMMVMMLCTMGIDNLMMQMIPCHVPTVGM